MMIYTRTIVHPITRVIRKGRSRTEWYRPTEVQQLDERGQVTFMIDMERLAQVMGEAALRSEAGVATEMDGLIQAKAIHREVRAIKEPERTWNASGYPDETVVSDVVPMDQQWHEK